MTLRSFRRFSFTLTMLLGVAVVAALTGSYRHGLSSAHVRDFGFAPVHLLTSDWRRLATSTVFTSDWGHLNIAMFMLTVCVGTCEAVFGSCRALAIFWSVHFVTLILLSLLALPFHQFDVAMGSLIATANDVGPSAGYYGCGGATCLALPAAIRRKFLTGVTVLLVVRLVGTWSAGDRLGHFLSADASHLLAFILGASVVAVGIVALPSENRSFST